MFAHYRPIFIAFLSLAFGIWLSKLFYYDSPWFLYATLIIFGVLFILVGLYYLLKKCKYLEFFGKIKWHLLTMIIPIGLGFGLYNLTMYQWQTDFTPEYEKVYGIYGTVDSNYIQKEKGIYYFLTDVTIIDGERNLDLDYNLFVYLYNRSDGVEYTKEELEKIKPGNVVLMYNTVSSTKVFDYDEINTFAYSNGYQYSTFTYLDNVTAIDGKMGFWDSAREYIRDIYKTYMTDEYAGLAFSVLVGDRTELDQEIANNFQISGIMHVVAVSGLNTAFIMMLLLWILNKVRANKWIKLSVVIAVLVFYALLCDMTPSIVRASMMSIFLLFGHLFGKQPDNLNSVSLSGIILLLFFPLDVFDLSFLLSYLGVFGIFLLYKPLSEALDKIKCKRLTDSLALTISATLSTAPIIINEFGYISLVGLLSNLILVPLFGFAFMILFLVTILAAIIPFAGYILTGVQYGFWVVDKGAQLFASIPYASINTKPIADWALVGYYLGLFGCSRYCVAKKSVKYSFASTCLVVFIVGVALSIFLY